MNCLNLPWHTYKQEHSVTRGKLQSVDTLLLDAWRISSSNQLTCSWASCTLAPQDVQLSDAGKSLHTSQGRRNDGKQELSLPSH